MSGLDGNLSAASSVEYGSASFSAAPASGDSVDGSDSVDVTASESVVANEPGLQPPRESETSVDAGRSKSVTVTLLEPQIGKRRLTAWCWRFVSRFTPSINNKNVVCLVKRVDGKTCNHLMKWTQSEGSKRGTGTSGLTKHLEAAHPTTVKKITDEVGTSEERKAPIRAAIAGNSSAGSSASASNSSSLVNYMVPKMHKKRREMADLRYVIWCCINLRPQQMRYDDGFKLFVGALSPEYVDSTMSPSTFDRTLDTLYNRVKRNVLDDLRSLREECLGMGYSGAFLGAQLNLTTAAGEEYITFTVSYVKKGCTSVTRVALATRAFPGTHTAEDIRPWIDVLTQEYFADLMGESVKPSDVFLAFTVDQGGNVVNACTALGVPVMKCNCHRVNSAVLWALGIAGNGRKNKAMGELMKKLAALVGVFSHSAINNGRLKELQRLEEDLHAIYELIRRNDTRWTSQFKMMDRLLALKKPISKYFRQQPQNPRKLTSHEWTITNEVCSLLGDVSEATIRMQGAGDTHVSQAMFIMHEVMELLREDTHPIRVQNATVMPLPPDGIPTDETQVTDLTQEAQDVREVLLEVMGEKGMGKAEQKVERLSALMDPRRKLLDAEQLENGSASLRKRAEEDLKAVIAHFEVQPSAPAPAPAPAPVLNVEPAEPAFKKKKLSRLEERRAARVAAASGGDESGSVETQAPTTSQRVLIEREVLVYLAEKQQVDVDGFKVLGFWNRRGADSVCPTTGKVTSPAEMPYLAFIARLYLGIEATSCQAERNSSALSHLIGHLRCNMLARKVERMMLVRLNRHLVDEIRELDAAVAQARAKASKSAQISLAAQEERANKSIDLSL